MEGRADQRVGEQDRGGHPRRRCLRQQQAELQPGLRCVTRDSI